MMDSDQALSLVYSSDGKTLATAGFDGVVHLWDMIKAKKIADLKGEKVDHTVGDLRSRRQDRGVRERRGAREALGCGDWKVEARPSPA